MGAAITNDHPDPGLGRQLRGCQFCGHTTRGKGSICAAAHRQNIRRNLRNIGDMACMGIAARAGRIEPVHIRKQNQQISRNHAGNTRCQTIIIPIADFIGGDRVIFIHHRNDAQPQ